MANSLNEDLTDRYVVLKVGVLKPEFDTPEGRVFHARGGFGCRSFTNGTAVFGEFVGDGEECRMSGYDFARFATDDEIAAARHARGDRNEALALDAADLIGEHRGTGYPSES
jgi:hypothetical protein